MSDRTRWGILSTARIAREKVIPALFKAANVEVTAIASRDERTAREAAAALRIPRAHGSYEALLDDPEVDVVYIPVPNHLHVDWSLRALEAGKHVLVEKPLGMDAEDAERLVSAAAESPRLKVMEGFMYRFHPQWIEAKRVVDEGEIGRLQQVHSHFSYFKLDPDNIRNQPDAGGGGLMDIGCYDISLSRYLFGGEPLRVVATVDLDPGLGVDRLVSALLDFGAGRSATFSCGTQMLRHQRAQAFGSEGRIELEIPFNAPQDGPCRLWRETDEGTFERVFDRVDQYTLQAEAFSRAVLDDTDVPLPLTDGLANMRVLDAIKASSRQDDWVAVPS
ncbi:MAG: gfo/Idh/MocA family oxidoreductase [Trueperaceae bacterium]|nr:MAG: gfo/Idh/MocA family oxidoreductase [Trueperaceae bacterium]